MNIGTVLESLAFDDAEEIESDISFEETCYYAPDSEDYTILESQVKMLETQSNHILTQKESAIKVLLDIKKETQSARNEKPLDTMVSNTKKLVGYPMTNMDAFWALENDTTEGPENKRVVLFEYLTSIGAISYKHFMTFAMKQTLTDELFATNFSWKWTPQTAGFGMSKMANVIFLAAKHCPYFEGPDTRYEFKHEILQILRRTKRRHKKAQIRKEKAMMNGQTIFTPLSL